MKAQESMDRANEKADDEKCYGNADREKVWSDRAKAYRGRMKKIKGILSQYERKLASCLQEDTNIGNNFTASVSKPDDENEPAGKQDGDPGSVNDDDDTSEYFDSIL